MIEPGRCSVLIRGAAVGIYMRDREGNAIGSERAIDKSQRGSIRAIRAIDTTHLVAPDGELVGVRLALVRSPTAAVIVGVSSGVTLGNLRDGRVAHSPRGQEQQQRRFSDHKFMLALALARLHLRARVRRLLN